VKSVAEQEKFESRRLWREGEGDAADETENPI